MADDVGPRPPAGLYARDFYSWTTAQAAALRAAAARPDRDPAIDWANIIEEVESLGRSDLRECLSRVEAILEHLYKRAASRSAAPLPGWATTIVTQRTKLRRALTPSLRALVKAELESLHADAAEIAARSFAEHEPGATIDPALRWTLAQVLGEADDPIA